jgi:hypothetical protein
MNSWIRFFTLATCALVSTWAGPSAALEKASRAILDDSRDEWRGGTPCSIRYYNLCTGWLWAWSQFDPGTRVGVNFTSCCAPGELPALVESVTFFDAAVPAGYGFTGTIDVFAADGNGCPTGPSLGSQPLLPASQWNIVSFASAPVSIPTNSFVVAYTWPAGDSNPTAIGTDHPAAGPTGPAACGTCYPNTRTINSFVYGTAGSPICPGSTFNDGVCDAQLMWEVNTDCVTVSIEPTSWGQIKNLYR